ncbi:MAG: Rhomboid protease GlpG [Chlamydiae bacterium]|nr:Rhomboid protease GlpG [Chlamydiota bacterium]
MRLICTITTAQPEEDPYVFCLYLTSIGISNELEEVTPLRGEVPSYRIWAYDEEQIVKAQGLYAQYHANPKDPLFHVQLPEKENSAPSEAKPAAPVRRRRGLLSPAPFGKISILILLTVIFIFGWAQIKRGLIIPPVLPGIAQAPLLSSVDEALIYDYPTYFQLRDQLLKIYTPEQIKEKVPPSADARALMQEIRLTPYWVGFYDRVVNHFRKPNSPLFDGGPMFEKISEGEVWRIFTPALLHFDLLHIFFNVLWFIMLGNQIEHRLGSFKYLLLILFAAIVSNTSQYLMSGSYFMGLSGIVCGFAAFIWARQQIAPWEGYLLHRLTLIFLGVFVFGMFALQTVFFILQLTGKFERTIGIANTAHLSGAMAGYLLGRLPYFCTHRK